MVKKENRKKKKSFQKSDPSSITSKELSSHYPIKKSYFGSSHCTFHCHMTQSISSCGIIPLSESQLCHLIDFGHQSHMSRSKLGYC
jgi:hypothetical protein